MTTRNTGPCVVIQYGGNTWTVYYSYAREVPSTFTEPADPEEFYVTGIENGDEDLMEFLSSEAKDEIEKRALEAVRREVPECDPVEVDG